MKNDDHDATAPQQAECPKCRVRQEATPITVIEPQTEALKQLFKGDLNQAECRKCGTRFLLQSPLIFRDDAREKLIYYIPVERRDAWAEAEKEMQQITESIADTDAKTPKPDCRLTLTRRSFIEKVAIHLDGRDDRVIEYLKYQLYRKPDGQIDPVRTELLYDFSNQSDEQLKFIIFDRETGQAQAATHIPIQLYDELVETFLKDDDMKEELDSLFSGHFVNVEKLLGLC